MEMPRFHRHVRERERDREREVCGCVAVVQAFWGLRREKEREAVRTSGKGGSACSPSYRWRGGTVRICENLITDINIVRLYTLSYIVRGLVNFGCALSELPLALF